MVGIGHKHRYGVVLGYDGEEEIEIGVDVRLGEALGGLRPDVHALALLLGELLHYGIGD